MKHRNVGMIWVFQKKSKFGFKQKSALKRLLIDKQNPFKRSCRIKFEIPEVMSVCEDWGKYEQDRFGSGACDAYDI